jgi:hypothetical protein
VDNLTVRLNNGQRKFNYHQDNDSLFNGYQSRYRTKFKIEAGVIDDDYSEVSGFTFYGILYAEPTNSDDGTITIPLASMLKVFENYPSSIVDKTGTPTTAQMVTRLVTLEKSGNRIFDQYFEGATDGDKYKINTGGAAVSTLQNASAPDDESVWKKLGDYCVIDDFFCAVDSTGAFAWESKTPSGSSVFTFNGAGSSDSDYGVNIVSVDQEVEGFTNAWGRVAIEYTDGTFAASEATWTPGDGSVQDLYGERTFSAKLIDLDATQAAATALKLRLLYQPPRREWAITTIFCPVPRCGELVTINYVGQVTQLNPFVLGVNALGVTTPQYYLSGRLNSINLENVSSKVISRSINLDEFVCNFRLREV